MALTALRKFLAAHRRIALDSCVFIYHLDANADYVGAAEEVFAWLEQSPHSAVTSTVTMTELLVHPYRAGDETAVNQCFALLSAFPNLEWVAPDLAIADAAARIRAQYRIRTPDALQVATAIRGGATALLTNDADIARATEIEVGVLDRFF